MNQNPQMNHKNCVRCQQRQGEFICTEPQCLLINNNQMVCFQCFWQQHQKLNEHKPKNLEDLNTIAYQNYEEQKNFFISITKKQTECWVNFEVFLDQQKETFISWLENQKKSMRSLTETKNLNYSNLVSEINQAFNQPNLNTLIKFQQIQNCKQQEEYNDKIKLFTLQKQFQFNEIKRKIDEIVTFKFSLDDQFSINKSKNAYSSQDQTHIQFTQCHHHQQSEKYICTHQECLDKQSPQKLMCKICFKLMHSNHDFNTNAKKLKTILFEQQKKISLIFQQQESLKLKIQQEVYKNIELIWQQQNKKIKNYEQIRNNLLLIKEQSLKRLEQPLNHQITHYKINKTLLNKTTEIIMQEYSMEYQNLYQKMSLDLKKDKEEMIVFTLDLDIKCLNNQDKLCKQFDESQNTINELKNQLNMIDEKNKSFNFNFLNQLTQLLQCHLNIKQQIENLREQYKDQFLSYRFLDQKELQNGFKSIYEAIISEEQKIQVLIQIFSQMNNSNSCSTQRQNEPYYTNTNEFGEDMKSTTRNKLIRVISEKKFIPIAQQRPTQMNEQSKFSNECSQSNRFSTSKGAFELSKNACQIAIRRESRIPNVNTNQQYPQYNNFIRKVAGNHNS